MPAIKNRTTVYGHVCSDVVCANLKNLRTKDVSFENKKVKEMDGRSL